MQKQLLHDERNQCYVKVVFSSFHFSGLTLRFDPEPRKVISHERTCGLTLEMKGLISTHARSYTLTVIG